MPAPRRVQGAGPFRVRLHEHLREGLVLSRHRGKPPSQSAVACLVCRSFLTDCLRLQGAQAGLIISIWRPSVPDGWVYFGDFGK